MRHIHFAAALAAALAVFAFTAPSAQSRPCDNGEAGCVSAAPQQAAPMKLDQFMKTWKPVSAAKATKKSRKAKKPRPDVEDAAADEPAVTETEKAAPAATASDVAAAPQKAVETDGVAVTSFSELNELDAAADQVQVVAFNEVNEIDLAAPEASFPAETTGQSVSAPAPESDKSWIGKLLLAVAGTIAVAGATRLLVA